MILNKIAFVGAGSIVEAMITGILNKKFLKVEQIWVTNRRNSERLEQMKQRFGVNSSQDKKEVINNAGLIILAVKPKDVNVSLESIKSYVSPDQLVVSVLAGVSTDYITEKLEGKNPVVRAMPNTSALIGHSATAISQGRHATVTHLNRVKDLFDTIGTTAIVEEDQLHAVTGLSGSGPAYIYYLVEGMEKAASQIGLEPVLAKELIYQTLAGAAEMLKVTGEDPAVLRKKITSPGGTTEAGIEALEMEHFQEALINGIKRASERSVELGQPYQVKIGK